jgi:MEDS: MEthanogen/methylotroph, DcmR Sensory domain
MKGTVPLGFTGETFPPGIHMCYIYSDEGEREKIIFRFIDSGLRNGENVSYFMDVSTVDEMEQRQSARGMDRLSEKQQGHLSFATTKDVYCPTGIFVPDDMLDKLTDFYTRSIEAGYTGARATGEMSWALRGIPGSFRLMEYEARVNTALMHYPVTAICQYDARCFDGTALRDVLAVHPMIILHGQVLKNPYYVQSWWLLKRCRRLNEKHNHQEHV